MADAADFAGFDNPFAKMVLDEGHCFLCGKELESGGTREHIFPKWLLDRHGLWNDRLTLLNGSSIPYRLLTVPCCSRCNNEDLSRLERAVERAFRGGYAQVAELDELTLFQWAGKVFFALLYKEMSLLVDRADPAKGTIVPPEFLSRLDMLHGLLQSVYRPVDFGTDAPFSILVVNLHEADPPDDFNFHDSLFQLSLSLRSHDVGIIVALEDARLNAKAYGRYITDVAGRKLHAVQFDELSAKVAYNCRRLSRVPKFIFSIPPEPDYPYQVITLPLQGLSAKAVTDPWVQEEYVEILWKFWAKWGFHRNQLFVPPDRVMTLMTDEAGQLLLLDGDSNRVD